MAIENHRGGKRIGGHGSGSGSNELLRELLEITALSHASTNRVAWGAFGVFAFLSLSHTSRLIGLELFAV